MQFASALSTKPETPDAIEEVCRGMGVRFESIDLAVLFVSHQHGPDFAAIVRGVHERLGPKCLIGCTGESIVGLGQEVEDAPAISLWVARLPGVNLTPVRLEFVTTPEGGSFAGWPDSAHHAIVDDTTLLLLAEPFSFPADGLLERLGEDWPKMRVLGGMASGAHAPGQNVVFVGDQAYNAGAVGVLVDGDVQIRSVVSQGCRPIGRTFVITKAERNMILEMSGKPPLAQFQEVLESLSPEEHALVQRGLHVGQVIDEYRETFERGDFLIRNVLGADRKTGAIAIGDYAQVGRTVQFHIRDAQSADEDLRSLLSAGDDPAAQGALVFTCNGRGTRLFDAPHHDARVIGEQCGEIPLAGFFAQGEIGPVGGRNFLHGFTASVALFQRKT